MKLDCGALNRRDALGHPQARLGQWRTASRASSSPQRRRNRQTPTGTSSFELSERHAAEASSTNTEEPPDQPRQGFGHPHGHKVSWFSLEHLGALVRRHSADDTAAKAIKRIMRADVIVIDDIGLLPVATETAEALYRVVDAAYEKRSIALSSNLHPAGFDELMPKTIANATVDRLLHHAHVVLTAGDSIRLTQATAGKGVTPLTN